MTDPIVEEVRRVRQEYAKQFNYDLQAIAADLHRKEITHQEQMVSFPPRPAQRNKTAQEFATKVQYALAIWRIIA